MPVDRRLAEALAPVAARIRPEAAMRRARAVDAALTPSGDVAAPSLGVALWLPVTWWLPGPLTAGGNIERELVWPQAATLRSLVARCKGAPVGSAATINLVADGDTLATVTIPAGQMSAPAAVFGVTLAAGQIVTLSVTSVGTTTPATDVTLTLAWSPA